MMLDDRADGGNRLASRLSGLRASQPLVLGLPGGGVPVAAPIADALHADLDVIVVRKLGAPGNPEFALGAVGEDGVIVVDEDVRVRLGVTIEQLDASIAAELAEVEQRVHLFRGGRSRVPVAGRSVIIVDDGLATGSTATAAVQVVRNLDARRVMVAVPVGSAEAVDRLRSLADEVVCLRVPEPFHSVGGHYQDFSQVSAAEVVGILMQHDRARGRTVVP